MTTTKNNKSGVKSEVLRESQKDLNKENKLARQGRDFEALWRKRLSPFISKQDMEFIFSLEMECMKHMGIDHVNPAYLKARERLRQALSVIYAKVMPEYLKWIEQREKLEYPMDRTDLVFLNTEKMKVRYLRNHFRERFLPHQRIRVTCQKKHGNIRERLKRK